MSAPSPDDRMPNDREMFDILRDTLNTVEGLAGHEFALIDSRMNWFAVSQSFLFGAFAMVATDPARVKLIEPLSEVNRCSVLMAKSMLLAVPIVGIVFAIAARWSVAAASDVLDELVSARGQLTMQVNALLNRQKLDEIPVIGDWKQRPNHLRSTIWRGEVPLVLLPWGMVVVWIAAVVIQLGIF